MFQALFLIFLIVPIVEIYLLIQIGSIIGALPTVLFVIMTAIVGAIMIRIQGIATIARVQRQLLQGELPAIEVLEGVILLVCGALLLTPGFFTDSIGFIFLVRPFRLLLIQWFIRKGIGPFRIGTPPRPPGQTESSHTIEGEYWKSDDPDRH